jgi:hypothetical protein
MAELQSHRKSFELALKLLLQRWLLWTGDDEIRALSIGFDSFNTEICVSLLTDREPRARELEIDPMSEPWPVASWRLFSISRTGKHCFPDAAPLLDWMRRSAHEYPDGGEFESEKFNEELKKFFFEVATSESILDELKRFRRVASPFRIRVHWFFERAASLEYELR